MSVAWSITSSESGRFNPIEQYSEVDAFGQKFEELRSRGRGYFEVRQSNAEYPRLGVGFQGDQAVVHLFLDEESVSLLEGDGTFPEEATVELPIVDESATFTGGFVLGIDHAWSKVLSFAQTGTFESMGNWCEL
ncbi:hypothetical protein [Streptomyces sp. NPDC004135]